MPEVSAPKPALYRVNLVCACQQDVAYGCDDTAEQARIVAEREFKKHHGARAKYSIVVVEKLGDGEKPCSIESEALHYEFTDGLGSDLDAFAKLGDDGKPYLSDAAMAVWAKAFTLRGGAYKGKHPYVYECAETAMHKPLVDMLKVISDSAGNPKLRAAAERAHAECRKLARQLGTAIV